MTSLYSSTFVPRRRTNFIYKTSHSIPINQTSAQKTNRALCGCSCFKCFQLLVYLCSASAFLYFLITFVLLYLTYPTIIIVGIDLPWTADLPALTICSNNLYLRSRICNQSEFPDMHDEVCANGTDKTNSSQKLKEFLYRETAPTLKRLSHQKKELFKFCHFKIGESQHRKIENTICSRGIWVHFEGVNCWVLNPRWFRKSKRIELPSDDEFHLLLDLQKSQYLSPDDYGADIYLHKPEEMPDRRSASFIGKDGKSYFVGFIKTSIQLLEPPYQTKCKNYSKVYRKELDNINDHFDSHKFEDLEEFALGDTVCKVSCYVKLAMSMFNCVPDCLIFSYVQNKCAGINETIRDTRCSNIDKEKYKCDDQCPPMCDTELYDIMIVEENFAPDSFAIETQKGLLAHPAITAFKEQNEFLNINVSNSNEASEYVELTLHLQAVRHITYTHSPKYEPVEILGYIGGYLGIFLGVSLPLVVDHVVTILKRFFIVVCFIKEGPKTKR